MTQTTTPEATLKPDEMLRLHHPLVMLPKGSWDLDRVSAADFEESITDFERHNQRVMIYLLGRSLRGKYTQDHERHVGQDGPLTADAPAFLKSIEYFADQLAPHIYSKRLDDEALYQVVSDLMGSGLIPVKLKHFENYTRDDAKAFYSFVQALTGVDSISPHEKKRIDGCLDEMTQFSERFSAIREHYSLFDEKPFDTKKELLRELLLEWRETLKVVSALEELPNFYSPTTDSTGSGQHGPDQWPVRLETDYQRWNLPKARDIATDLGTRLHQPRLYTGMPLPTESMLCDSGLNAFATVLRAAHYCCREEDIRSNSKPVVLYGTDTYFELEKSARHFLKIHNGALRTVPPHDIEQLLDSILKYQPFIVVVAPVTNSSAMRLCNIRALLEGLSSEEFRKSYKDRTVESLRRRGVMHQLRTLHRSEKNNDEAIVEKVGLPKIVLLVDNSATSTAGTWHRGQPIHVPNFVDLVAVESLVKYAGSGLELGGGGLITRYAVNDNRALRTALFTVRQNEGTGLSDVATNRLAFLPGEDILERRMQRFGRNSFVLSRELSEKTIPESSLFSSVVHPELLDHPDHELSSQVLSSGGGILWLRTNEKFIQEYQDIGMKGSKSSLSLSHISSDALTKLLMETFSSLCVDIAKEKRVTLNLGTSFGFDTTRMTIYPQEREKTRGTDKAMYVNDLRIAVGTETLDDIYKIAEVMHLACARMEQEIKKETLYFWAARYGES